MTGADIDRDVLFTEDRIKTYYIDQRDPAAIEAFWQKNTTDIMIRKPRQLSVCRMFRAIRVRCN